MICPLRVLRCSAAWEPRITIATDRAFARHRGVAAAQGPPWTSSGTGSSVAATFRPAQGRIRVLGGRRRNVRDGLVRRPDDQRFVQILQAAHPASDERLVCVAGVWRGSHMRSLSSAGEHPVGAHCSEAHIAEARRGDRTVPDVANTTSQLGGRNKRTPTSDGTAHVARAAYETVGCSVPHVVTILEPGGPVQP